MKTNKNNRRRLFLSVISLILCISMLLGTTLAWFTDSVSSTGNIIKSGRLKVAMHYAEHKDGEWKDASDATIFDGGIWEPGYSEMKFIKVSNTGNLAFSYKMHILPAVEAEEGDVDLAEVIDVYVGVVDENFTEPAAFSTDMEGMTWVNTLDNLMGTEAAMEGILLPNKGANGVLPDGVSADTGDVTLCVVLHMQEKADNRYQNLTVGNNFTIQLVATQYDYEQDNFGGAYDGGATYPDLIFPEMMDMDRATAEVTPDPNNKLTEDVTLEGEVIRATVAAGTLLEEGATKLVLTVSEMDETTSNITLDEGEAMRSMDVHVSGLSKDNTVPVIISLGKVAPEYLNQGNLNLAHVENGQTVPMTRVDALTDLDAHNEYYYDIHTGELTVAMATFSEVALVADTENAWNGEFDYTWYDASKTELTIANADQLAAFGAIVGGMKKVTGRENNVYTYSKEVIQDSFAGKTVKLLSDIDLGDKESENNPNLIFYPIGYWNNEGTYERKPLEERKTAVSSGFYTFEGIFDGNGHTISNFYQNTWEMKGDHDWYNTTTEQYYRDGMGLFGRVYGGTVKNLTIRDFKSDGEITTTGCVAAYADFGATFENIAIFDCNPRVYNIGNGGIVGCVGWYTKDNYPEGSRDEYKVTFKNITVDNSNKISALWGSYDVACGGLVGQYYPTSGQTSAGTPENAGIHFDNCHVSAIMDVYNDVCANYQYYAYRYTGMLIGSVRENVTDTETGHVYPNMTGITAENCTVHFGTWNDYYYCEIIDNTTASYTHDYQMSRLTENKAIDGTVITYLDGTTGTVPASGRANYVIVDYTKGHGTENATCYHFKDGAVWTHKDGGYEEKDIDGDGDIDSDVLKEDKQHIYLEFNNLITGYGWGVTSKGVKDFDGVTNLDITVGNHDESVKKFKGKVSELANNQEIKLADIFAFENNGVAVKPATLTVTVTDMDDTDGVVTGDFIRDGENWENGTITFSGTGNVQLTIQDYYFCTPTTIEVTINERQSVEKFDIVMNNGDFLHRVGNVGTVALDKLFKANVGDIGKVAVTIENVAGDAVGTYTDNAKWEEGTIQFSGTGVVKVTIEDEDQYSIPTELNLEVVTAWNTTSATGAPYVHNGVNYDVVLLNEVPNVSSMTVKDGYSFYGNGFTIKFNGDGSYRSAALSYGFVTVENGGVLDNTRVVCRVFPTSYMYTTQMKAGSDGRYPYGYSAIVVKGNSTISNCYVYGARNNILVSDGSPVIENTTTECASVANIHINSASGHTVTLRNVTTIQRLVSDDFGEGNTMLGFGVLVGTDESTSYANIKIEGDFNQYNWVTEETKKSVTDNYCKQAIMGALAAKTYVHTNKAGKETANMGIAFLKKSTDLPAHIDDDTSNMQDKYELGEIVINGYEGQVYSIKAGTISAPPADNEVEVPSSNNREVMPDVVSADQLTAGVTLNTAYNENELEWVSTLSVDLDKISGGSYTFNFSQLKIMKHGVALNYTVEAVAREAVDMDADIVLNQMESRNYILTVTDNQIYDANGQLTGKTEIRKLNFVIHATKTSIEPPKFTNAGTATAIRLVEKAGGDWRPAYTVLTGVSVTYWSASEGKVKTVDLSTLYNSGTINSNVWAYTCDDYTLTITGGAVHSDGTTITPVVANNTLYFASTNKAFGTGTTSRNIVLTYVFTDKNDSTTWNRSETVTYSNLSEYSYSSFKNDGKLEEPSSGGSCVTPDTLITLADGSQVRVDSLTGSEELLVWNMETGKLDSAPILFVDSDPEAELEIVHLYFSDGTDAKVIYEHGFWDYDLNKYVYLDANAADYIGHTFAKQNGDELTKVQLTDVVIETEVTTAWSPVTAGHLCYFVNGMLSMPGGVGGLFNIFEVDPETMTYDIDAMQRDIEKYGLFTYEEMNEIVPLPEEMFEAAGGAYLKVSIGKGNMTMDDLVYMIERYTKFFG